MERASAALRKMCVGCVQDGNYSFAARLRDQNSMPDDQMATGNFTLDTQPPILQVCAAHADDISRHLQKGLPHAPCQLYLCGRVLEIGIVCYSPHAATQM